MTKSKLNRSQAIRDHAQANPDAKPKAIAEFLKTKGIKVSPGYVSSILFASRKRGGKKPGRTAANGSVGMDELLLAKELVQKLGIKGAKKAMASYARLVE